jgi:membrane-bound lytic murein transglycosylase B
LKKQDMVCGGKQVAIPCVDEMLEEKGGMVTYVMNKILGIVMFAAILLVGSEAGADQQFKTFLNSLYAEAAAAGIDRTLWDRVFATVDDPDILVLEKAKYQPEFTVEIWDYLDARVHSLAIEKGQAMARQYARTLADIERRFGVEKEIVLAIWSMESAYGAILDQPEKLHYVPRALATLAYGDAKRAKFARTQIIAVLKLVASGDVQAQQLMGSWAGAMGQTQFIPTSFLAYGIDMDGNGQKDIWHSVPDALATAANLLHKNSWRTGKTWGYEITLPPGGGKYVDATKELREWQQLGFVRSQGKAYPRADDKAVLKLPGGTQGPAFLVLKNFYIIKRYNNADAYALAVGLLADRLAGYAEPVQDWPRPPTALYAEEKLELQSLLKKKGLYDGKIDGLFGESTRAAIRSFQQQAGLAVNEKASRELLEQLRK